MKVISKHYTICFAKDIIASFHVLLSSLGNFIRPYIKIGHQFVQADFAKTVLK